jgi:hypothetical protein
MKTIAGLLAVLFFMYGSALFAQESGEALIRELTGTVEIKAPGAANWTAAQRGQKISKDTLVSTGFKSTALIAIGNSTLTVRPLTRLSLEEIQNMERNESVRLSLQTGRIRVDVKPPAGGKTDFTVRSPTVTASVRGTSFDFDGVNLVVDEGLVHVSGGDGTAVYVSAGHQTVSDPETGRTAGIVEMVKAELTPAISAAATESIPEPAAIVPAAANRDVGFSW